MYQERIMLSVQDIFDKEFKVDTKGYRSQEVDKYLDLIMRDYEEFIIIINELKREVSNLNEDNSRLRQELRNNKLKLDVLKDAADSETGGSSVDILKRISNLEKIIYGRE